MNNYKKSKTNFINSFSLRSKFVFYGLIVVGVLVLTFINNLYFYKHVEYYAKNDAKQLIALLESELNFCRENRVSQKRYRDNMTSIVETFSKYAYYNDELLLKSDENKILFEKYKKYKDGVTASNVEISMPYLKNDKALIYKIDVDFSYWGLFFSVFRSMTFSLTDIVENFYNNEPQKWEVYFKRSRPALGYAIFTFFLLWVVRRRFYQFSKIEQILNALDEDNALKIKALINPNNSIPN